MKDFSSHDATSLAALVRSGDVSPRELVTSAIERIESLNPKLNAVVHKMYDSALKQADGPLPEGPFKGVPFLLKDLSAWYAGEPMTWGSRLFKDFIPPHDSETVARFRRAGVIVLGKTNTPEFGLSPYTEPELHGPSLNPWDTGHTTGGSSGGSGGAVASGMVPFASASDGGGSIRVPASCCGIFGLKPTRGRVPTGPVNGEVWQGASIEHCVTRSVRDSAAMLDAISGPDAGAPYWAQPPERPFLDEVNAAPRKLRVGFTTKPLVGHSVHPDCVAAVNNTAKLLESLGHEVFESAPPVERDEFNRSFLTMICGEINADLRYAEKLVGRVATHADVEVTTWALNLLGTTITAGEFVSAENFLRREARRVGQYFETIDVLLTPTLSRPPVRTGELQPPPGEKRTLKVLGRMNAGRTLRKLGVLEKAAGQIFDFIPYTPLFNVTGQPAMSLPLHWNAENLPIGVQVVGRYADEATLFNLASQLEQALPWKDRHPPLYG
jgi:amidase